MGVNFVRLVHFTKAFAHTQPEDFVRIELQEKLNASHIVTGDVDFVFGRNRQGDVKKLADMAVDLGMKATAFPQLLTGGRGAIPRPAYARRSTAAQIQEAGQRYRSHGPYYRKVWCATAMRGRELGFPTANILPPPVFLPALGIYAVRVKLEG